MTCTASRIKRDKRDLKRELADPSKAEAVARFCDYWWLVCDDEKVYAGIEDQVPKPWGILVRQGDGLRIQRDAPKLESPTPMTRGFLAGSEGRSRCKPSGGG